MNIINKIAVLLFVIVGGLILSPMASATPSQGPIPNIMYANATANGSIAGGLNFPHNATEIAVWDADAVPGYGTGCPLPGSSGGIKWQLMADNNNDGNFTKEVGYYIPTNTSGIMIINFGDGGNVNITTYGGANVSPANPLGGYKWVDVDTEVAGTDNTEAPGQYEFASCGQEGFMEASQFVGTSTAYIFIPSTNLTKKVSSSKVHVGDEVTYTYYEKNDGTPGANLYSPYVKDDKCSPVNYSSGDNNSNGVLEVGETWVYTCSMILDTPGQVTNTAVGHGIDLLGNDVTYPGYALNGIFEDLDEMDTTTVTVIDPGINLTKTPSADKVLEGTNVTYTYVVNNTGDTPLTVTVTDDQYGIVYGPTVLAAGDSATATYTAQINANITNVATASGIDQLDGEVTAQASATVTTIDPGISLTKTPSADKVLEGTNVTYTYVVNNTGDTPLTVTVTDDQYGIVYGPTVLAAGDSATATYTAQINANITNVATATGIDQFDGEVTANATATVRTIDPAITVEKTCTPDNQSEPGTIDWVITVNNTGDVSLNVVVNDSMHDEVFNGTIAAGQVETINLSDSNLSAGDYTNSVTAIGTHQLGDVRATSEATCSVEPGAYEGLTPGFWKTHPELWDLVNDTLKFDDATHDYDDPALMDYHTNNSFNAVFNTTISLKIGKELLNDPTLLQALAAKGGVNEEKGTYDALARHAVAALLNANHPEVDYPMTEVEIIAAVHYAIMNTNMTDAGPLKDQLEQYNELEGGIDAHGVPI